MSENTGSSLLYFKRIFLGMVLGHFSAHPRPSANQLEDIYMKLSYYMTLIVVIGKIPWPVTLYCILSIRALQADDVLGFSISHIEKSKENPFTIILTLRNFAARGKKTNKK